MKVVTPSLFSQQLMEEIEQAAKLAAAFTSGKLGRLLYHLPHRADTKQDMEHAMRNEVTECAH
ncbi:MAG: hypothetical protein U0350_44505 [Caldilineaceae bacterium]